MAETPDIWKSSLDFLRSLDGVPAAEVTADLLESVLADWQDRVVARTSMHDLLFTKLGQGYPWKAQVRASAVGNVFEFQLLRGQHLVTADRCHRDNAEAVLRSFLAQLEAEE